MIVAVDMSNVDDHIGKCTILVVLTEKYEKKENILSKFRGPKHTSTMQMKRRLLYDEEKQGKYLKPGTLRPAKLTRVSLVNQTLMQTKELYQVHSAQRCILVCFQPDASGVCLWQEHEPVLCRPNCINKGTILD